MNQRQRRSEKLQISIHRLNQRLAAIEKRSSNLMRARVLTFALALLAGLAGLALGPDSSVGNWLGLLFLAIGLLPFAYVVRQHRRVDQTLRQLSIWRRIRQTHLARMSLDWDQLPASEIEIPQGHPFALDLDIVGAYSVHRLIDTSVSLGGSEMLADWLLTQEPNPDLIQHRRELIRELNSLPLFRDRLVLYGELATQRRHQRWDGRALLNWFGSTAGIQGSSNARLALLFGLAMANIGLFLLFSAGLLPALWVPVFVAYVALSVATSRDLAGLFSEALEAQSRLRRLNDVMHFLESARLKGRSTLESLCEPLRAPGTRPSAQLRRISLITAAASLQRNPIFWMTVNLLIPWDITFGTLLARSKRAIAAQLPTWLELWYELEALSALSTFGDLNPDYQFPVLQDGAIFHAQGIGHPLVHAESKVTNDFSIDALGDTFIVTGSNMAGKSTFLRTLGVNLQLAYCGSVVNADRLQAGYFRVFTSIRVTDSIVDGFSYFYAEVRRLKALLDALRQPDDFPLFYLIDEIFRGTNNRERLIGSQSIIYELVRGKGIGLIATHDLELVKLEEDFEQIHNYHFREQVVDGTMRFDYLLRPGPCPTTNALKIMALEGLPVKLQT